jgi:uncharacterized OsmC-like protein
VKITLLSEDSIRLEPQAGMLTIEAPDEKTEYSPFHMLASSLATCSWSVLASWASNTGLEVVDLAIEVSWEFADNPNRVGRMDMRLDWPSLPAERVEVARRAAALCAIHASLSHPTEVRIEAGQ